jgi:hypothetical protein
MMNEYSSGDLMAAILALQDATATGLSTLEARLSSKIDSKVDSKVDGLRHEMNRRFDRVDVRFDVVERRLERLERRAGALDG